MSLNEDDDSPLKTMASAGSTRWLISLLFEGIARQERGLGVLYEVLDELAKRYELGDVLVVLDHEELGTQIFRHRAKSLEESELWRDDLGAGLYCQGELPDEVRESANLACQLALATHLALYGRERDVTSLVANEMSFRNSLEQAAARSARYGWAFTLILFDVHTLREQASGSFTPAHYVLRRFASTLSESVRRGDLVARLGETRYAVILHAVEWGEFWSFVERVRHAWRAECPDVDFYYGTAASPRDAVSPEEIIKTAEGRLEERNERGVR